MTKLLKVLIQFFISKNLNNFKLPVFYNNTFKPMLY